MAMKCSDVLEVLVDHMRGILSKEESLHIDEHIKTCPKCKEEFEEYLPMVNMLRSLSSAEAKAPKKHVQSILKIAKENAPPLKEENAPPLKEVNSPSLLDHILDWLRSLSSRT